MSITASTGETCLCPVQPLVAVALLAGGCAVPPEPRVALAEQVSAAH